MRSQILALFDDLDTTMTQLSNGTTLDLYHVGRSALVWQYDYLATTRDIDVLVQGEPTGMMAEALGMYGRGSAKSREFGIYLEAVPTGLPPMAAGFRKRAKPYDRPWKVIRLYHLDPHDLAVSKLKRFAAKDREDIRELCDRGLIESDKLQSILESAFYFHMEKDGNPDRDAAFAHLTIVQKYLKGEVTEF